MPSTTVTYFPVDNGDMTLIALGDIPGTKVLIDCNIREAADDPKDETRDVAKDLRERIKRDAKKRPYIDAFLLSHPDEDHCRGLQKHFYLGPPEDYPDDKKPDQEKRIFIRELWSSPMVFRRASKFFALCEDANAFGAEARRRVQVNRDRKFRGVEEGDRILIIGEDENGKTDDLGPIVVKLDQSFSRINWSQNQFFTAQVLGPLDFTEDEQAELELGKNHSSVILKMTLANAALSAAGHFLSGGDAEVLIWERLWNKNRVNKAALQYHMLQTPHHCSWHSLSYDSWSELRNKAKVSEDARSALSQILPGGQIVSSSGPIHDDDNDPPCWGAKREYEAIAASAKGAFYCTGEYPTTTAVAPLEFLISEKGGFELLRGKESLARPPAAAAAGLTFPNKPVVPNKPAGFA